MRELRNAQASIFDRYAKHEIGVMLKAISDVLDCDTQLIDLVEADLISSSQATTGRQALPVECVLRCAVLKQYRQLSYQELAFYLEDSASFRHFARLPSAMSPKKSTLQSNISRIKAQTWELINQRLIEHALHNKMETVEHIRIDSTVVETNIHEPSDSALLYDGIRMLTRLMAKSVKKLDVPGITFSDNRKSAKSLARRIFYTRGFEKKKPLYEEILQHAQQVVDEANEAIWRVNLYRFRGLHYEQWVEQVKEKRKLLQHVIWQTQERVFNGQSVLAIEKLVSLHEPHTDIIVKGAREVQYGHKLNLTTGKKGLVVDASIESGNPSDIERYLPMIERTIEKIGLCPKAVAADGGYACIDNLDEAKIMGIDEVAFQKRKNLPIAAMTSSEALYKKLCDFRSGIESNISELKRAYGLKRVSWRGRDKFSACVWLAICSYNLVRMARFSTA